LAFDGEDGLYQAQTGIHDLIILDIMLPGKDGISLLCELRKQQFDIPVILLTAKSETSDKVKGLDSGADDYLSKPFQTSELLARMRALTRRRGALPISDSVTYADIELFSSTLELWVDRQQIKLTKTESQLMEYLILNQGRILTPTAIIQKVWGYDSEAEDKRVQVYISFLRKKLLKLDSIAQIKTIRGVGYLLTTDTAGEDNHESN